MKLKKLLGNQSHWTLNKELAKRIGLHETLVLQHLIDWCSYHNKKTIFQTYEQICSELGLGEHTVAKRAIPNLIKNGFISTERKGVGYKVHYTIHEEVILDFLTNHSSQEKNTPLVKSDENHLSSQEEITPLTGENHLSSQVKTTSLTSEITPTISNNIANNNVDKENIYKESTINGWSTELIENKILYVLMNYDIHPEDKRYITAIEYYKEAGMFEGISQKMKWDDRQKENWWTRVLGRIEKQL